MPYNIGALDSLPRSALAQTPTARHKMPNLSAHFGTATLFIKRDDCTGLALGGNKARQLEFYLGQAEAEGADTLIITGAVQSNFTRMAAAAARMKGMDIHIQLEELCGKLIRDLPPLRQPPAQPYLRGYPAHLPFWGRRSGSRPSPRRYRRYPAGERQKALCYPPIPRPRPPRRAWLCGGRPRALRTGPTL
ncbi:MAG TPA: pyridoxal-phosphate dependent enzyme [Rhodobacteraceae bacterium]|nr:pyridoxal-phosphate dependent enzyme [Paracoccaceae bacterium]